jgi:hypothetical protein
MTTLGAGLRADDSGSIVFGWLTRLTLTLTLLGVAAFEVLSIAVAHVAIEDTGRTAADRALTTYQDTQSVEQAYLAADQYASSQGATLVKKSFEVSDEAVSFELKKTAPTLLLFRVDATAGYAEVSTVVYAEPIVQGSSSP